MILSLAATPVAAKDPLLAQPIACSLGDTCFIQNFVDRDPGKGVADFSCGPLSYDGHKGTDFALPTLNAMNKGVDVLAAAPGTVLALRDGMADHAFLKDPATIAGRECGNGVLIDHGGSWQTQYCHLKHGSVSVRKGQRVAKGTVLGKVGLSGMTQFPHLHFEVRHNDKPVDPFDPDGIVDCEPSDRSLWQTSPAYHPGGILDAGITARVPDYAAALAGRIEPASANPATLTIWLHAFGGRAGDQIGLSLMGPNDAELADHLAMLDKNQARFFRFVTARPSQPGGWPAGTYTGTIKIIRDGAVISSRTVTVDLRR